MRILAFMNQKGGVGKTTTTVNIGSILAHTHGKRVLMIDLDPQANLSDHLGVDPNVTERSIYDILVDSRPAEEVLHHCHGLDLLPATLDLSAAEIELASMMSRELRLKNAVLPMCKGYDYVLLDCPPSLGLLTISGLALADQVIVPMEAEYLALRGLSQLVRTIDLVKGHLNENLFVGGVIFCKYDGRTLLAKGVCDEVNSYFPDRVFTQTIRKNVRLAEAPSHGLPIDLYDPKCAGYEDYAAVTVELLRRQGSDAPVHHAQAPLAEPSSEEDDEDHHASTQTTPALGAVPPKSKKTGANPVATNKEKAAPTIDSFDRRHVQRTPSPQTESLRPTTSLEPIWKGDEPPHQELDITS